MQPVPKYVTWMPLLWHTSNMVSAPAVRRGEVEVEEMDEMVVKEGG